MEKKVKKPQPRVTLIIRDAADMSPQYMNQVRAWLKEQSVELRKNRHNYSKRYIARCWD